LVPTVTETFLCGVRRTRDLGQAVCALILIN
jgi:hypothetical protein